MERALLLLWIPAVVGKALNAVMCPDCPGLRNPCLNKTLAALPYCDSHLTFEQRAKDLIGRMTLEEKIQYLANQQPPIERLGLVHYNFWTEGAHGIGQSIRFDKSTPWATNFALPITASASFNRSLWHKTGAQISREARAFMNAGNAYSNYWTPVVNLVTDPRWGRNLETPGEDPFLTSEYAIHFVRGYQESEEAPGYLQASALCKHFAAYELENWNGTQRYSFNGNVSMQDLEDTYLPPFEACVRSASVSGIMCSYNAFNGVPSCANTWLLTTLAREQWKLNGYIVSDCDAIQNIFENHHYGKSPEEAVALALKAGTDMDCGQYYPQHVPSAVQQGLVDEALIDERLTNTFLVRFRLGHFDETPMQSIKYEDVVCTDYALQLSYEGTRQGTVLLKNDNKTLPWAAGGSVAVIGPNANKATYVDYYGPSIPCFGKQWTMVDAMQKDATSVHFVAGLPAAASNDTSGIQAAVEAAAHADKVVVVLGVDGTIAEEGLDQISIAIPDGQLQLLEAVSKAAQKPVVVVLLSGGALDVSPLLQNDKVGAILYTGQPSVTQLAVGDLIFGRVSPSGRMVQTTYPASFVNEVSLFELGMRPGPSYWPPFSNPGRTYRFYTGDAVLPFGWGLSYSDFQYQVVGPIETIQVGVDPTPFSVNVTNIGDVEAANVVIGCLIPPGSGEGGIPIKFLFGFERVLLKPGQSQVVTIGAGPEHFKQVGTDGLKTTVPGTYVVKWGIEETREYGMGYAEQVVRVQLEEREVLIAA